MSNLVSQLKRLNCPLVYLSASAEQVARLSHLGSNGDIRSLESLSLLGRLYQASVDLCGLNMLITMTLSGCLSIKILGR